MRQYELYRLLRWQEHEEDGNFEKRQSIIPTLRFGRSTSENDYNVEDTDSIFLSLSPEQENFNEEYLGELFKDETENASPLVRNSRSMLLLSTPKTEGSSKQKPTHTFVLPYPRPGRSSKLIKVGKTKNDQLILPYPRPGRSEAQKYVSKILNSNNNKNKYILPTARLGRASLSPVLKDEKGGLIINDWLSIVKSNPASQKLNTEHLSANSADEVEGNSFFVIPYPRPGKRVMFKLKNSNQNSKNSEKEITDYVLPYPRPGKKSGGSKETEYFLHIPDTYDFSDALNRNQNIDSFIDYANDNEFNFPLLRMNRNIDNILSYLPPERSASLKNEPSNLSLNDIEIDSEEIQESDSDFKSSEDSAISRFKRSSLVVPYPRLGRSNAVVPYPRLGRSNVIPYPRPGRSNSVLPYPRPGRSNSVLPYPRTGRSDAVVPYLRLGRSVVHNPHSIRSKRSSSVVPYPRLGRSESVVPYPRLGRGESIVPYPRPGRAEALVPYPRPGRAEALVPYPRPGRSESIVPYPRPGRSDSVVPYPRPGRSFIVKSVSPDKYGKTEKLFLPSHSNLEQGIDSKREEFEIQSEKPTYKNNYGDADTSSNSHSEKVSFRDIRATNDQGYVLPYPRVGRSTFQERKKRDSSDTDTVIPYPRLGRSQKETVPAKSPSENQNSVHKLNKHVLSSVEDSVYLLPYPRPGRNSK